ncbi:MAG: hypothetical protein J6V62_02155 [Paludibacteraceae bacterium]|nr:hypothetical protein [Paludibacteraceae bacterium]
MVALTRIYKDFVAQKPVGIRVYRFGGKHQEFITNMEVIIVPRRNQVQLFRPVVDRREQIAYEVLSLQRSAEPGCMIDDYVVDCANYVAKRVIITICNRLDETREALLSKQNYSLVLHVQAHDDMGDTEVSVIRWEHPIYHELNGEINLATSYGYLFARGVAYFYNEWFEALIEAFESLLDYSGDMALNEENEEDENHYKWYINVKN